MEAEDEDAETPGMASDAHFPPCQSKVRGHTHGIRVRSSFHSSLRSYSKQSVVHVSEVGALNPTRAEAKAILMRE